MTWRGNAILNEQLPDSLQENLQIEAAGSMIHVPNIQAEFFLPGQSIASVDLGPSGKAWPDGVAAFLGVGIPWKISFE